MLSAIPLLSLLSVFAVAGATMKISHFLPMSMWLSFELQLSVASVSTALRVSASKVRAEIKRSAEGVMTTCTSAPAFMKRRAKSQAL